MATGGGAKGRLGPGNTRPLLNGQDLPVKKEIQALIISEIELLLAEKRTALSTLRTGYGLLTLPLSIFGFLVVANRFFDVSSVLGILVAMGAVSGVMIGVSIYLMMKSLRHIHSYDKKIAELKRRSPILMDLLDDD